MPTTCDCCEKEYDIEQLTDHHGEWLCTTCEEELGVKEEEEEMEDCECCGYTHHSEDKCPNDKTAEHFVKWRDEMVVCDTCKITYDMSVEAMTWNDPVYVCEKCESRVIKSSTTNQIGE